MSTRPETAVPLQLVHDQRYEDYQQNKKRHCLIRDAVAGLIVALVSIPLGVGFAIASGLQPEQGIIAGAFAGILGGLFGGSKYQVYGPTAAFIPLLSGIVAKYDVPFLILASVIAGCLIVLMGLFKLGDHFSKVPFSVTVGFTIGIALCIVLGQLPDALGSVSPTPVHTLEKLQALGNLSGHPNIDAVLLAALTFLIIRSCYKISVFIPGPLIAIVTAVLLAHTVFIVQPVPLVADKLGEISGGIFKLTLPGLGTNSLVELILPVLSIVFIASLESLLSARMADRLAKTTFFFSPNRELVGQGIVNTVVPLLNGFPCTGAFARTATGIKAGATSPLSSLFNGSFMLILMLFFNRYIAMIPLACISGLLIFVACSMVKAEEVRHVFKEGRFHVFLMFYTALVTFLADLLIAVSSATAIYYLFTCCKNKRIALPLLAVGIALASIGFQTVWAKAPPGTTQPTPEALVFLTEGNKRFYLNQSSHPHQTHEQLVALSRTQHPFVAVLGCSDSRVPPEIIFDQGLGDIFDIRVAGNVVDPVVLGSLEYAVEHLNVPLIFVLGHERCGAIQATLDHENPHNHINTIIRSIAPAIKHSKNSSEQAAKLNVTRVLQQISESPVFRKRLESGQLQLVGGYYHLDSGEVEVLLPPERKAEF